MEKRVNSHVGRVMVVNVMIQYSKPGRTLNTARMTRPRRPNVDREAASTGTEAVGDGRALEAATIRAEELFAMELGSAAAAMVEEWSGRNQDHYRHLGSAFLRMGDGIAPKNKK